MWRSVIAGLAVILGSIAIWILTINTAWHIGHWVGGGKPAPVMATAVALLPSIIDLGLTIVFIPLGIKRRARILITIGAWSFVMAAVLLFVTAWFLAMGSIT